MKYVLFFILMFLSMSVFGQDLITPPDVGNGISWEENPLEYILLFLARLLKWALIVLVGWFVVKTFWGIIKGTNDYLNSRSDDSDTGKIVGSVVILIVGIVIWALIFAIFERIETRLIESVTCLLYTSDAADE